MRFAELFAGAGGLSMGLERAGWSCAWHAEISDAPRAILSHRWPDVPLYGDVLTLDGRELTAKHGAIDMLTGGSPCQDLSVAGKRAGLGGDRSSLFFEQMRLWDETGADLCLWENVDGARSSNEGKDFGEVLRAFVGAAVAVPSDGWRSAGVAAGPTGVAAWRILDAQFFGVPQRRRRVFVLGTRTGRVDPAEVLSLAEGLPWDSSESGEAREGVAADARCGSSLAIDGEGNGTDETFGYLNAHHSSYNRSAVVSFDWSKGNDVTNPRPSTLNVRHERTDPLRASTVPAVVAFDTTQNGRSMLAFTQDNEPVVVRELSPALKLGTGLDIGQPPCICAFNETGHEAWREEAIAGSLNAHEAKESHTICLTGEVTHALTHEGHDASEDGTGRGTPIGQPVNTAGIPRRLTPRECERLMAWPDDHTLVPDAKGKLLSDSARYKACGNGVASVHSHWIGWRLAQALEHA